MKILKACIGQIYALSSKSGKRVRTSHCLEKKRLMWGISNGVLGKTVGASPLADGVKHLRKEI